MDAQRAKERQAMTTPEHLAEFGNRIGLLRQQNGMTQATLAAMVGVARSSIANIELGNQEPGIGFIAAVAQNLGVSCDVLIGTAEYSNANPLPWIDLVTRVTADERKYRKLADDCWSSFDPVQAVRYRGMADGLDLARTHQAAVIAEARAAS
jgi:transcriptional regulator with XRE-family HTH domain